MLNVEKIMKPSYKISADADVFIIPNGACSINSFMSSTSAQLLKDCAAADIEVDDSTKFIQVWFVCKDLDADNLGDHGGRATLDDGTRVCISAGCVKGFLPEKAFEGKVEGDTMEWNTDLPETKFMPHVNLTLNLKLNQSEYRYRNHGKFEDVVKKVCAVRW